jgi:elongator complex protein 4
MELLCDGVIELIPLPANPGAPPPRPTSSASGSSSSEKGDQTQGLLRAHTLPVYHEKGGGSGAGANFFRETLSFSLSASRGLVIKPYSLPPLEADGEEETKKASGSEKGGIDF